MKFADFNIAKEIRNVIIANRIDEKLEASKNFIYSRDIFSRD